MIHILINIRLRRKMLGGQWRMMSAIDNIASICSCSFVSLQKRSLTEGVLLWCVLSYGASVRSIIGENTPKENTMLLFFWRFP